jgi:hypothetical protein
MVMDSEMADVGRHFPRGRSSPQIEKLPLCRRVKLKDGRSVLKTLRPLRQPSAGVLFLSR